MSMVQERRTPIPIAVVGQRRMMRFKEAAEYSGFSIWKLRESVKSGKLPYYQEGGSTSPILLDQRDIDAYLDQLRKERTP
jgi:hypothetical protein